MKKISTLFKKNPDDLRLVTREVDPENDWVLRGEGVATRKWDGTACAIINGAIYKRYDVKRDRKVPNGAIACQEPDEITGHWPHWVACDRQKPEDKYFFEAWDKKFIWEEGTYELIGEKINNNNEGVSGCMLIPHGKSIFNISNLSYEGLKEMLSIVPIEGLVFYHPDGRMCKIRRKDFGLDWPISIR